MRRARGDVGVVAGGTPVAASAALRPGHRALGEAADGSSASLRSQIVAGVRWKAAYQISAQMLKLLSGVLLARLLSPRQFGVGAEVLVFSMLAGPLGDLSLGAALVQRRVISELDRATA